MALNTINKLIHGQVIRNNKLIQLDLDCPYFLSTGSKLIYNKFPKAQQVKREKGIYKNDISVKVVHSKILSNKCNLTAQAEQVQDIMQSLVFEECHLCKIPIIVLV